MSPRTPPQPAATRNGFAFARSDQDRVIAGVAGGLAQRVGIDAVLIRITFVVLAFAGGFGILLYAVAWLVASPPEDTGAPTACKPRAPLNDRRTLALGLIALGGMLLLREMGVWFGDAFAWPLALAAAGSAIIWSRSDEADRERWTRLGARLPGNPVEAVFGGRVSAVRIIAGGVLVAAGIGAFLAVNEPFVAAGGVLVAVVVTVVGLGLIFGPWALRLARQLGDERRERIRSEERAEMAAHLHDSVLHTLALIQRTSDAGEMTSLARVQERELRAWLYGRGDSTDGELLSAAIDAMAGRVEAMHPVAVETVVVGDAPLDERLRALVHACGEAVVNAARHSGVGAVSVYAEVEAEAVTAFVRDEGKGFDIRTIPPDRHGISHSIRGRIQRHGGSAVIMTEPGEGTEVQLTMPRGPHEQQRLGSS